MKKIYSLLAAACVSVSAFAIVPPATSNLRLSEVKTVSEESIRRMIENPQANNVVGMQKATDLNTGNEWAAILALMGKWNLVDTSTGREVDFNEYPFYQMLFACQPMISGDNTFVQLNINWPSYGALDDDCIVATEEDIYWDIEKVEAKYGDQAFKPMSYEDFMTVWNAEYGVSYIWGLNGFGYMPGIICGNGLRSGNVRLANGDTYFAGYGVYESGNGWNLANAATFDWSAFDDTTSSIKVTLDIPYMAAPVESSVVGKLNVDLDGSAVIFGFSNVMFDTIGQVHIFNGGRQKYNDEWTWNYTEAFSGALNFYYIAMSDDTMGYFGTNQQTGEFATCYGDDTLPVGIGNMTGAPGMVYEEDYHFTFFAGAIWAPEGTELPYGKWAMAQPEYDKDTPLQKPAAYNLTVPGLDDAADIMGFYGLYEGYSQYPEPETTFLGIGDKKYGVNFSVNTSMTNGHPIIGSFTGEIYYHQTPEHWVDDVVMLPATSDGDYDVITGDVSVKVVEESNAPVVSTSYYNFQGQRLSSEPDNGMYIIRTVKADGTVKATKVAK